MTLVLDWYLDSTFCNMHQVCLCILVIHLRFLIREPDHLRTLNNLLTRNLHGQENNHCHWTQLANLIDKDWIIMDWVHILVLHAWCKGSWNKTIYFHSIFCLWVHTLEYFDEVTTNTQTLSNADLKSRKQAIKHLRCVVWIYLSIIFLKTRIWSVVRRPFLYPIWL